MHLSKHDKLDTESVISILESTFKNRPDESQGGLIEEKIQKLHIFGCQNVDFRTFLKHLHDNKNSYVVK